MRALQQNPVGDPYAPPRRPGLDPRTGIHASVKRILMTSMATFVLATAVLVGVAPASHAAGCVTRQEFARVQAGMTMGKVARIFGTNGIFNGADAGTTIRLYDTCTTGGSVYVAYTNGKVVYANAFF
ncbi:MAG: hypothetical protein QG597_3300 [Actinomycetota bacterium]|nr:hypothetical protein [Actinomycetota bacterium]